MSNPLLDKDFLYTLDQHRHKEVFARVIALTFEERPIEQIEGRVTAGSINIDGDSAVRRSCNLTLVAKELNINDFYWGLTNKFSLEIGLKNEINPDYPEIIWFKQGIFYISSFNTSISTNNYTVQMTGKDKMCLLNGEIGGSLPSSVDFGKIESYDVIYEPIKLDAQNGFVAHKYYIENPHYTPQNGQDQYIFADYEYLHDATNTYDANLQYYERNDYINIEDIPIKTIIREAVHTYAHEPYHNIIVNDLEDYGLELLEYRGDTPLYMLFTEHIFVYEDIVSSEAGECTNMTPNGEQVCYAITGVEKKFLEAVDLYKRQTASVYEKYSKGEITRDAYSYACEQAFRAYQTTIKDNARRETLNSSTLVKNNGVDDYNESRDKVVFLEDKTMEVYSIYPITFSQTAGYRPTELTYAGDLIASVGESVTSILDKIKNMLGDFEYFYDIDGHFVFQRKKTYVNTSWNTLTKIFTTATTEELIADNSAGSSSLAYSFEDTNLITAFQNTPQLNNLKNDYSVWGKRRTVSGVEVPIHARLAIDTKPFYYRVIGGYRDEEEIVQEGTIYCSEEFDGDTTNARVVDWREIIFQMAKDYYLHNQDDDFLMKINHNNVIPQKNANNETVFLSLYPQGFTGYERYYTDMEAFWRELYNPHAAVIYPGTGGFYGEKKVDVDPNLGTYKMVPDWIPYTVDYERATCDYFLDGPNKYWHVNVVQAPYLLNFWLEFLDDAGELAQFAIPVVGDRPKVINDADVTAIYFRETPNAVFMTREQFNSMDQKPGYTLIQLTPQIENLFNISPQKKSAKDRIDELLYNHSYCIESISITSVPVYYLQPNSRIFVHDDKSQINGEYIVSKLTIPLTYNGTMSISATKAVDRIY